jgi:hypothetical protein
MSNNLIFNTTPGYLVRSLCITSGGAYGSSRRFEIGFERRENDLAQALFDAICDCHDSSVTLEEAHALAEELHDRFAVTVQVRTEPRVPSETIAANTLPDGSLREGVSQDDIYVATALRINDISRLRDMIRFLDERGLLATGDRSLLNPVITECETVLSRSAIQVPEATVAQRDILRTLCEPWVEEVIEGCRDIATAEQLLGSCAAWLSFQGAFSQREAAQALLLDTACGHHPTLFQEYFGGLKDLQQACEFLQKIYKGTARLESAYEQTGGGIPVLSVQREVLYDVIEEKLNEAFGPESRAEGPWDTDYLCALRRELFASGYHLDVSKSAIVQDTRSGYRQRSASASGSVLLLQPFQGVIDALNGDFSHRWDDDGGQEVLLEERAARLTEMLSRID